MAQLSLKTAMAMAPDRQTLWLTAKHGGIAPIGDRRLERLDYLAAGSYKGTPLAARFVLVT